METTSINRIAVTKQWWSFKRIKYNKGLLIAGVVAFILYCILGPIFIAPHAVEFEETIFEMAFQGVAYLIMIVIANVFYTLGSLIDISLNTNNSQRFRNRLFSLGY
jgi:hydrogenase-4 membrane subunit HyfE